VTPIPIVEIVDIEQNRVRLPLPTLWARKCSSYCQIMVESDAAHTPLYYAL
jgi:hypothetical protein